MFPYMLNEGSIGSYEKAFKYSIGTFCSKDPGLMAKNSDSIYCPKNSFLNLISLGQKINISFPTGIVSFHDSIHSPRWQWNLILLNYLARADNTPLTNKLISFRELENGQVFYPAFLKYTLQGLSNNLGALPLKTIKKACLNLGANLETKTDLSAIFYFLPRFPITFKYWPGDEEVTASANLLFDASANHYLHTEDVAAAGELLATFIVMECQRLTL